jgi:hypothetical protein
VHDQTGGPDGTILGNVLVGQTPPFPGAKHAVTFDGATGAIDLGDRFGFVGVAPYSIEVWDLPGTVDGRAFYELASKWRVRTATTPASGWNLFYSRVPTTGSPSTTKLGFTRETELGTTSRGAFAPAAADRWHHVVGTYDGTAVAIYVDGVFVERNASANSLDELALDLLLGAGGSPTQSVLLGSLGEAAIYDYALDSIQISTHYDARKR